MTRKTPASILVSALPAHLHSARDAEPIALALSAQAKLTRDYADELPDEPAVVVTTLRTQADKLSEAADETRKAALAVAEVLAYVSREATS
jgi:hypothetical protein